MDFVGTFSEDISAGDMARYVKLFFLNGGTDCYVMRLADSSGPRASVYGDAYPVIAREVDLFNLMILPPDRDAPDIAQEIWGGASAFCQQQKAFLLIDPPSSWCDARTAAKNIAGWRDGLVKDHCALYYPRVLVDENGRKISIGASGAIAGLMARTDSTRGVWKAPAGSEASLRGVTGLAQEISDPESDILNRRAINVLRRLPNGIVCWGARTLEGDDTFSSELKYIPVRRLSLMIAESLFRGLDWVVFEPNNETLWAQIRFNVSTFMSSLFRQGAFAGQKTQDAYLVKCDSETMTQSDIYSGAVNILVGFAPLKPAEFFMLRIQINAPIT